MNTFVMLTRVSHEGLRSPQALESLEKEVMAKVRSECPDVNWLYSYAVLGSGRRENKWPHTEGLYTRLIRQSEQPSY